VKARIERGRERREEKKTERLRELQEKERERQTNFLNQLGLDKVSGISKSVVLYTYDLD